MRLMLEVIGLSALTLGAAPLCGQATDSLASVREAAGALARAGEARGDARTLLAAAQLMVTAERRSPNIILDGAAPPPESPDLANAAATLRRASQLAVEQFDIETARLAADLAADSKVGLGDYRLAAELRTSADALGRTRGAASGPIWADGRLKGGEEVKYRITFNGGFSPNRIDVSGSRPGAKLECALFDGTLAIAEQTGSGRCSLKWSQKVTGAVTLKLRNGGDTSYYTIVSN